MKKKVVLSLACLIASVFMGLQTQKAKAECQVTGPVLGGWCNLNADNSSGEIVIFLSCDEKQAEGSTLRCALTITQQ